MNRAKYKLTNAIGITYDLSDWSNVAFASQKGLGFEEDADYFKIGKKWFPAEIKLSQNIIKGKMVFIGTDNYQKYFDFVQFVKHEPLVLEYETDAGIFYIDVRVSRLGKEEADRNTSWLISDIEFSALGLFYRVVSEKLEVLDTSEDDVYPFTYDFAYGTEKKRYINIISNTVEESPVKLIIHGAATNPSWFHYVNGKLIATGAYTGTIDEGKTLVIDAINVPYSINECMENGAVLFDRYQFADFSTERFLFLQEGFNVILLQNGVSGDIDFEIEARLEYESV